MFFAEREPDARNQFQRPGSVMARTPGGPYGIHCTASTHARLVDDEIVIAIRKVIDQSSFKGHRNHRWKKDKGVNSSCSSRMAEMGETCSPNPK